MLRMSSEKVVPPRYFAAYDFSEGVASVQDEKGWSSIGADGKVLLRMGPDWLMAFSGGLAPVIRDRKVGYIDRKGKLVIAPRFLRGFRFSEGFASVELE